MATVAAGLVEEVLTVDECTVLVVGDDTLRVVGEGAVRRVRPTDSGTGDGGSVVVTRLEG